jgi:hypothetical protein
MPRLSLRLSTIRLEEPKKSSASQASATTPIRPTAASAAITSLHEAACATTDHMPQPRVRCCHCPIHAPPARSRNGKERIDSTQQRPRDGSNSPAKPAPTGWHGTTRSCRRNAPRTTQLSAVHLQDASAAPAPQHEQPTQSCRARRHWHSAAPPWRPAWPGSWTPSSSCAPRPPLAPALPAPPNDLEGESHTTS